MKKKHSGCAIGLGVYLSKYLMIGMCFVAMLILGSFPPSIHVGRGFHCVQCISLSFSFTGVCVSL